MAGERELLETTAAHGFIAGSTIAAVLGLEERLLVELVDRLGGEVHFPALAETLATPSDRRLVPSIDEEGTYTLRTEPPPMSAAPAPADPEIPW